MADEMAERWGTLPPGLMTWVWAHLWKDRTKSCKLSSDLHMSCGTSAPNKQTEENIKWLDNTPAK